MFSHFSRFSHLSHIHQTLHTLNTFHTFQIISDFPQFYILYLPFSHSLDFSPFYPFSPSPHFSLFCTCFASFTFFHMFHIFFLLFKTFHFSALFAFFTFCTWLFAKPFRCAKASSAAGLTSMEPAETSPDASLQVQLFGSKNVLLHLNINHKSGQTHEIWIRPKDCMYFASWHWGGAGVCHWNLLLESNLSMRRLGAIHSRLGWIEIF